ncbi:hypothetical protein JCM6882_004829 [Rhodosporidiobolus microsporus]
MMQLWRTCVQAAIHWPSRLEAFLTSDPVIHCTAVPAWFAAYSYLPLFGRELGQVAVPGASAAWAQFASKHESIGRALSWWPDRFPDDGEKLRRALGDFAFTTFVAHLLCNFCVALVIVQWQVFPLLISFFRRRARSRVGLAPYQRIEELSKDVDASLADVQASAAGGQQPSSFSTAARNNECKVCLDFYHSWRTLMSGDDESKRRAHAYLDLLQSQPTAKSLSSKLLPHPFLAAQRAPHPARSALGSYGNKMYALLPPDTALLAVLEALPAYVKHCDEVGSSAEEALSWNYPQMEKERVWIRAEERLEEAILDAVLAWKEEKEERQA